MPTTKLILYKQKVLSDGTHPILLQIIHNRKVKKISLRYSCRPEQWDKQTARFNKNLLGHRNKNKNLRNHEVRADDILDDFERYGKPFTFSSFEKKFKRSSPILVSEFFDELIQEKISKGKIGTSIAYRDVKNALKRYKPRASLMFQDIDYSFLMGLESFLLSNGCREGGVAAYMRSLRAVINEAIRRNVLEPELYPFSTQLNRNGYSISHLKSKVNPRALSIEDMEKMKNFPVEQYPDLDHSWKWFLFSYYSRGMNYTDIAKLKWSDLYDGRINYHREKTGGFFSIRVSDPLKQILDDFDSLYKDSYIFPILSSSTHKSPTQIRNRINKCLKQYNRDLKEIAELLEIDVPLTSYVARHTYATTLKRRGIDPALISENLGHQDIKTTNAYLKKFEDSVLDEVDNVL